MHTEKNKNENEIIIIGAGISGLFAAKELINKGIPVTMLEARNRIGGRVYSKKIDNYFVECGANWQEWEITNPIAKYLNKLKKEKLISVVDDNIEKSISKALYYIGAYDKYAFKVLFYKKLKAISIANQIKKSLIESTEGIDLSDCNNKNKTNINKNKKNKIPDDFFNDDYQYQYLSDIIKNGNPTRNFILGGYSKVCNELIKEINEIAKKNKVDFKIKLENEILSISDINFNIPSNNSNNNSNNSSNSSNNKETNSTNNLIVLEVLNKKTGVKYKLSRTKVICTIPLGVIQHKLKINNGFFNLTCNEKLQEIFSKIRYGTLNKVFIKFKDINLLKNLNRHNFIKKSDGDYRIWTNLYKFNKSNIPILIGEYVGKEANSFATRSSEDIKLGVLDEIKALFPNKKPEHIIDKVFYTNWKADPYALGTYPGGMSDKSYQQFIANLRSVEKEMAGAFYFSGDYAVPAIYGTVHGAAASGIATVKRLLHDQKSKVQPKVSNKPKI